MQKNQKAKILAIIPARGDSKRIPNKNIKLFNGKPLIYYTIKQAQESKLFDRIMVDTDSEEIAKLSIKLGSEAPFLRPKELAHDKARVVDAVIHLLNRLKQEQDYKPTHITLLQTTSPFRELQDIHDCWNLMKKTNATTVLTVAPTHPRLYHMDADQNIFLVNGLESQSTNMQEWRDAYILNGCFVYIVKVSALQKEGNIITKNTKAIICDKWRSVDLDEPEDWVLAEFLHKHKHKIHAKLKKF